MTDKVIFLLDSSGSMNNMGQEPVECMNQFVKEQHANGSFIFTLVLFNNKQKIIYNNINSNDIAEFKQKDYIPSNMTALYDAIGFAISNEPDTRNVIFVILTDGLENSSTTYTHDQVKTMITEKETNFGWKYIYLGCNQDAYQVGNSMGISQTIDYDYNPESLTQVFRSVSHDITTIRQASEITSMPLSS